MKFDLVTKEEAAYYMNVSETWLHDFSSNPFDGVRMVAATAVAEFLANRDGFTLFTDRSNVDNYHHHLNDNS